MEITWPHHLTPLPRESFGGPISEIRQSQRVGCLVAMVSGGKPSYRSEPTHRVTRYNWDRVPVLLTIV